VIDLSVIKDDPDRIRAELKKRGSKLDVDKLVELDGKRRELQQKYDERRAEQKGVKDKEAGKELKQVLKEIEGGQKPVQEEFNALYLQLPNFAADDVPEGKDESENRVAKEAGDKPQIKDPKPHYEIPAIKPLIDFERGAKVSGNRFWYLKGALVQLEFALTRYALDFYEKKGFLAMRPPTIVNHAAMKGTGFFPAEENEIYEVLTGTEEDFVFGEIPMDKKPEQQGRAWELVEKMYEEAKQYGKISRENAREYFALVSKRGYLSGTAEVPLASYHSGERLDDLPVKYIGFAPAYRREAGSYGKDTKGILRGHEFDKLELFVFSDPEKSWDAHAELQQNAEEFWASLGIPFQVVDICTGDLGAPNAKKTDIEAWMPGEGKYREVASNSNDTDFQARRLKIKSNKEFVHTLNNTACAIGRAIACITENYQRDDGSVDMPKALLPYLPFKKITPTGEPA
jgi:seryl-tRNA synthetase